jgi:transcriptional regulator with XRE-family HTH domain
MKEAISDALRVAGITQRQLAELCGTHEAAVSRWIAGTNMPTRSSRKRIADACGVTLEWLERRASGEVAPAVPMKPRRTPVKAMSGPLDIGSRAKVRLINVAPAGETGYFLAPDSTPQESVDYIELPGLESGEGRFATKVLGDSMEPRLLNGHIVVCRWLDPYAAEPEAILEGSIVFIRFTELARLNECCLAIWSFDKEANKFRLTKANPKFGHWRVTGSPEDIEQIAVAEMFVGRL